MGTKIYFLICLDLLLAVVALGPEIVVLNGAVSEPCDTGIQHAEDDCQFVVVNPTDILGVCFLFQV